MFINSLVERINRALLDRLKKERTENGKISPYTLKLFVKLNQLQLGISKLQSKKLNHDIKEDWINNWEWLNKEQAKLNTKKSFDLVVIILCKDLFEKIVCKFDDLIKTLNPSLIRFLPASYDEKREWFHFAQGTLVDLTTPENTELIQEDIGRIILSLKKDLIELNPKQGKYQAFLIDTLIGMYHRVFDDYSERYEHYCLKKPCRCLKSFFERASFTDRLTKLVHKYNIQYKKDDEYALLDALFWNLDKDNYQDIITTLKNTPCKYQAYKKYKNYEMQGLVISSNVEKALAFMQLEEPLTLSVLKKRYRVLAKKYHPDISKQNAKMFQQLSKNYDILINYLNNK